MPVPAVQWSAGLLAGLAVVAAVGCALWRAPGRGVDVDTVFTAAVVGTLGGLLGGHALYVAVHGAASAGDWLRLWGDQSVFGVLIGGATATIAFLRLRGCPVLPYADLAAPAVALGYAIARTGCFLNGDDFGALTNRAWGVSYPAGTEAWHTHAVRGWITPDAPLSLAVVPVQLLLALAGAAIFAFLIRVRLPRGGVLGAAAVGYGVARFALEPLRDDFAVVGPLSLPQLFACLLAAIGATLLAAAYRRVEQVDREPVPTHSAVEALR